MCGPGVCSENLIHQFVAGFIACWNVGTGRAYDHAYWFRGMDLSARKSGIRTVRPVCFQDIALTIVQRNRNWFACAIASGSDDRRNNCNFGPGCGSGNEYFGVVDFASVIPESPARAVIVCVKPLTLVDLRCVCALRLTVMQGDD